GGLAPRGSLRDRSPRRLRRARFARGSLRDRSPRRLRRARSARGLASASAGHAHAPTCRRRRPRVTAAVAGGQCSKWPLCAALFRGSEPGECYFKVRSFVSRLLRHAGLGALIALGCSVYDASLLVGGPVDSGAAAQGNGGMTPGGGTSSGGGDGG